MNIQETKYLNIRNRTKYPLLDNLVKIEAFETFRDETEIRSKIIQTNGAQRELQEME